MSVEELIAALGNAEGPSYNLDCAIHEWRWAGIPGAPLPSKPYTASIDAALSLVPEGWEWQRYRSPRGMAMQVAHATGAGHGHHISPAIALCIAALRARETA